MIVYIQEDCVSSRFDVVGLILAETTRKQREYEATHQEEYARIYGEDYTSLAG